MKASYIILIIIGFFLIIGVVDAGFIMLAISSYPGVVTANPYQKGMDYNKVLQQSKQQNTLKWDIQGRVLDVKGRQVIYEITIKDKDGIPVDDAKVGISVVRPLEDKLDFIVQMQYMEDRGYQAKIDFPRLGQWELRISITQKNNHLYHRERIVLGESGIEQK